MKACPKTRAIFDANSGLELPMERGRAMDRGDEMGLQIAQDAGNTVVTLDEAGTARGREAAPGTIDNWLTEMEAVCEDGESLLAAAQAAMEEARN